MNMKGLANLGNGKRQGSGTMENNGGPLVSPKGVAAPLHLPKAPKEENGSSGKQGFISKITSRTSLKSKKTKSGKIGSGLNVLPVLAASKTEKELTNAFNFFDADKDGKVSIAELRSVLTSLGGTISEEDLLLILKEVDKDNDGFISLQEFVEFHNSSAKPLLVNGEISPVHDPLRDAFQTFDKDGDNRISASELQAVLVSLGDKGHSLEECRQMISSVDKDGDGYVDFLEFQELMAEGQDHE